jgi:Tfp pilus assembly protein PilX
MPVTKSNPRRHAIGPLRRERAAKARRPAAQDGFALPSAVIILLVITLLVGAAIAVATQTSTSTSRDDNVKAELEASEAGQHVASYRLTQLTPTESQCINESEAVEPTNSPCNDSSESLGNHASFRYWTTLPLKAGDTCAGRQVTTSAIQRCITSEGNVNGVEPAVRLQTRVSAPPLTPVNGILGLDSVTLGNNKTLTGKGGTNGKFTIGNNSTVEGVTLGPAGETQVGNNSSAGTVTKEATNFTLNQVRTSGSAVSNSNYRIENGLDESSGVAYDPKTRSINVGVSLTLTGEVYNFCNFTTGTGAKILVNHKPTKIFIDSPNDPGSKCSPGDGKFSMGNGSSFQNPYKDASVLQIYVYDEASSGTPVTFVNNVTFYGVLYAPNSVVNVKNNAEIVGAIAARVVEIKNSGIINTQKSVEGLVGGPFQRSAWEQCKSGSGPSEGC